MTDTYILNTNDKARDRLRLQHQLYAQSSIQLIKDAGIVNGMKGLEIGCGSGDMTLELLKLIGTQGDLLAIDLSEAQINYVQQLTKDHQNIRLKAWDVNDIFDLNEQFDFIYCRMVLHHVADAHSVLFHMKNCLKPGGIMICEEPSLFDSTFCYPPSTAYVQFTQWVRACFIKNKRDFEVAYRLEQAFNNCGLKVTHHSLYQPMLNSASAKTIYSMALDDLRPQLLQLEIASAEEIEKLSKELKDLALTPTTMTWIRMHNIIGWVA